MRLIGANPRAAVYAGFPMRRITILVDLLPALGSGIVGILLTSYLSSSRADVGATLLLPVLPRVVIGGVSMFGGEGDAAGVIVASCVIGFLQQGLRFAGMTESDYWLTDTINDRLALVHQFRHANHADDGGILNQGKILPHQWWQYDAARLWQDHAKKGLAF
ncbi:hypothetical protein BTM36_00055 [Herbaspirillum sp. VT-16-41]|nr:hypothetical protein BTM36_00055 [Herbaspirillum sp. VT-16-41]